MADKAITIYCISPALDGEGGTFEPGDKVTCDTKVEAGQLLATGRFSEDEEVGKRSASRSKSSKKEADKPAK